MSAAFIFLIIIILVGAAIGGLYFLGLPPFNKTKRAIGQKVKDEDVDEDILREVVLDKILDLEELGETITTEQATKIQEYFDLDDTHMPYVYETLGVTVEDTSDSENGTPVTGGPVTDTSDSENGTGTGYEVLQNTRADNYNLGSVTFSEEDGDTVEQCKTHCNSLDDCVYFSPSITVPGKCFFFKGDADILSRDADVGVTTYKKIIII